MHDRRGVWRQLLWRQGSRKRRGELLQGDPLHGVYDPTIRAPDHDRLELQLCSCVDTKEYVWNPSTPDLKATKSADDTWTSYLRNGDGLVIRSVEADTNDDASNIPAGARVTYSFY